MAFGQTINRCALRADGAAGAGSALAGPSESGLPGFGVRDSRDRSPRHQLYSLHGISRRCNTDSVDIDWPEDFGRWLDRLKGEARSGDGRARLILTFTARALDQLRNLADPPTPEEETATLRWVRQSRRYQLWRVSHAYHPQVAVRLICWFPPGAGTVVVALYAADKVKIGDVFYDGAAARADPMIDQWKRETAYEEKP